MQGTLLDVNCRLQTYSFRTTPFSRSIHRASVPVRLSGLQEAHIPSQLAMNTSYTPQSEQVKPVHCLRILVRNIKLLHSNLNKLCLRKADESLLSPDLGCLARNGHAFLSKLQFQTAHIDQLPLPETAHLHQHHLTEQQILSTVLHRNDLKIRMKTRRKARNASIPPYFTGPPKMDLPKTR